jgi:hypothetical protein
LHKKGFNYQFDALAPKGKPNELNQAFTDLFHSPQATRNAAFRLAQSMLPILKFLVCFSSLIIETRV